MKRVTATVAVMLTIGLVTIQAAQAAPGWHRGERDNSMMSGRGHGRGYDGMVTRTAAGNRTGQWGPGYCFNGESSSYGMGPAMMGYGYGPMHRGGYSR